MSSPRGGSSSLTGNKGFFPDRGSTVGNLGGLSKNKSERREPLLGQRSWSFGRDSAADKKSWNPGSSGILGHRIPFEISDPSSPNTIPVSWNWKERIKKQKENSNTMLNQIMPRGTTDTQQPYSSAVNERHRLHDSSGFYSPLTSDVRQHSLDYPKPSYSTSLRSEPVRSEPTSVSQNRPSFSNAPVSDVRSSYNEHSSIVGTQGAYNTKYSQNESPYLNNQATSNVPKYPANEYSGYYSTPVPDMKYSLNGSSDFPSLLTKPYEPLRYSLNEPSDTLRASGQSGYFTAPVPPQGVPRYSTNETSKYSTTGIDNSETRYSTVGVSNTDTRYSTVGVGNTDTRYSAIGVGNTDTRYSTNVISNDARYSTSGNGNNDTRYSASGAGNSDTGYSWNEPPDPSNVPSTSYVRYPQNESTNYTTDQSSTVKYSASEPQDFSVPSSSLSKMPLLNEPPKYYSPEVPSNTRYYDNASSQYSYTTAPNKSEPSNFSNHVSSYNSRDSLNPHSNLLETSDSRFENKYYNEPATSLNTSKPNLLETSESRYDNRYSYDKPSAPPSSYTAPYSGRQSLLEPPLPPTTRTVPILERPVSKLPSYTTERDTYYK